MKLRPLFQRRVCLVPTWRGWLLVALAAAGLAVTAVRGVYGFLAVEDPVTSGVLVAEGWEPDYALAEIVAEFRRNRYAGIFVTGVPLEQGSILADYKTFAELSAATLIRLGADPQTVHAIPSIQVPQDRTYATAVTLRDALRARGFAADKVNVMTLGPHARRTRLLYEMAFGAATRIGVVPIPPQDYEPARWWRSSQGFRTVISEIIAYLYARFLFHADPRTAPAGG